MDILANPASLKPSHRADVVVHRRPSLGAILLAMLLFVLAPVVAFIGWFFTAISACCGSAYPPDETAATTGALAACAMVILGITLLVMSAARRGSLPR